MKIIPFLNLSIPSEAERLELLNAIDTVFQHGRIILGPEVSEFENTMAKRCGRKWAKGVNSGSDALYLCLRGLGIGPGDEVITTSLSWIATANAITLTGAKPVFADIQEDLNIDPISVSRLINPKVKALLPVHYTGKICNMEKLQKIANEHNILLIEDAAQAFGAKRYGKTAGSFGDAACFSLNSMKVLAACGEAGFITGDNTTLQERIEWLRYNGTINRESCVEPALNSRMDTIQAAILLKRLSNFKKKLTDAEKLQHFMSNFSKILPLNQK
ncbi:Daunorubicin biosynthesis sensory transduction protein dnrJ (fragment) [Desulfamplus magnetovallimortis]|uniref:Daunorubicin biosynthesis sensory transduction protein dnrJ n=1 Tax=Desulfamplus magnetovallimortis TaxID=1246637 RepID=A0A1W1HEP7_9BACT